MQLFRKKMLPLHTHDMTVLKIFLKSSKLFPGHKKAWFNNPSLMMIWCGVIYLWALVIKIFPGLLYYLYSSWDAFIFLYHSQH